MIETQTEDQTTTIEAPVPLYCYHSKPFLVEELALQKAYQNLHYGRCCVIGKIAIDFSASTDSCNWFVENIRLPSLPKIYSLPEGTLRLPLIHNSFRLSVSNGQICEIVGETVLYNINDKTANKVPLTSKDVTEKLNYLNSKANSEIELETFQKHLLSIYKPAIAVDYIKVLERGHELAERNIELRMLLQK